LVRPAAPGGRRRGGEEGGRAGGGGGGEEARRAARPPGGRAPRRPGRSPRGAAPVRPPPLPAWGSLPGRPSRGSLRPGGGERAGRGRPSSGAEAARGRLRGPARAGLPWLLWGLAPATAADRLPSPPTCPGRHVGRKRRVTQRPNGCRGGSGGGGAARPELPWRPEAGGGGRRAWRGPSRSATAARRGLAASCVRPQGGVGRGGRPAARELALGAPVDSSAAEPAPGPASTPAG
ncbi:PREDICTED: translation initiation factor IF-2-like, partial [Chinchilla lanigera]|uniref:translation initiation factor IF-2-like n=1 Tax=Chinchilla lanigera TaxID=34839 RepID=UPI000698405B